MNQEAIRWIEYWSAEAAKIERGEEFDWKTRKEMFQLAENWLIRSRKLWPPETNEEEGIGVTNLRDWMNDPENIAAMEAMFKARGWLPPVPKKAGRPSKSEAAQRERFKAQKAALAEAEGEEDDKALQALLRGKIPKSKETDA